MKQCECGFSFDGFPELTVVVCPKCGRMYRSEEQIGRAQREPQEEEPPLADVVPSQCPRCGELELWQEIDDARHLVYRLGKRARIRLGGLILRRNAHFASQPTAFIKFQCGKCGYEQDYNPNAYTP